MQLQGKRIIVTGGAQGIGASVVRAYAMEGAHVASLDIQDDLGKQIATQASDKGPGIVRYYHCDISVKSAVEKAFSQAVTDLGGLDVMVNIAGVEKRGRAQDIPEGDLDLILNVNVKGTVYTNQIAFKYMHDQGGRIINFGSGSGLIPAIGQAHYSASKGAVISWTRTVAYEWGRFGITANAIVPAMRTQMYEKYRASLTPEQLKTLDAQLAKTIPVGGQLGDPDRDLAPVMVFLAGDGARFITGQIIPVDGGSTWTR